MARSNKTKFIDTADLQRIDNERVEIRDNPSDFYLGFYKRPHDQLAVFKNGKDELVAVMWQGTYQDTYLLSADKKPVLGEMVTNRNEHRLVTHYEDGEKIGLQEYYKKEKLDKVFYYDKPGHENLEISAKMNEALQNIQTGDTWKEFFGINKRDAETRSADQLAKLKQDFSIS